VGSATTSGYGAEGKTKSMNIPQTYADWIICFDEMRLGTNDEATLSLMEKGVLSWSSGVAERFSSQLFDLINYRIEGASKRLQRNFDMARGNETAVVTALLGQKRELKFLKRLTMLPAIPDDKKVYFAQQIQDYATNAQQSMENSAKSDRTGRLGYVLRNNRIDTLE
jgi:hypothetical protein